MTKKNLGRAGRTGPGVCFRLYSEDDYNKMEDFTLPEIKRISLESLIMQILDMNLEGFIICIYADLSNYIFSISIRFYFLE